MRNYCCEAKAKSIHKLRAGDPGATPGPQFWLPGRRWVVPPEPQRPGGSLAAFQTEALTRRASDRAINVDIIFPVLHGTFGGTAPSRDCSNWRTSPHVGAGVLGSAAGMDKDVMKSLFGPLDCPSSNTSPCCAVTGKPRRKSAETGGRQAEVSGVREAR